MKPGRNEEGREKRNEINFLASWFLYSFPDSKWRRHGHEEDRDHDETDPEFGNHSTEISHQAPPACPARVDHSLASEEFSGNCANHRPDKQSDDSEKDADHCTEESADHSPFCRSEIFCAQVAT